MATPVTYDHIASAPANPVVTYPSTSALNYPDSDMYNVFGPLYLPKVYGKDLSAFELASSGYIAVTLNDVYAFNLKRDDATNTVELNTTYNDNMLLSTGDKAYVSLSATNSNVLVYAGQNITQTAGSNFLAQGGLNAQLLLDGTHSNAALTSTSNIDVKAGWTVYESAAGSNAVLILDGTKSNVLISSASNVDVKSAWTIYESAAGSNAVVFLDGAHSNVYISSASNIYAACPETIALSCKTFTLNGTAIDASAGKLFLGGSNAYIKIIDSNIDYYAQNRMHFMVSNNTWYENQKDFDFTSSNLTIVTKHTSVNTNGLGVVVNQDALVAVAGHGRVTASNGFDLDTTVLSTHSVETEFHASQMLTVAASNGIDLKAKNTLSVYASTLYTSAPTVDLHCSDRTGHISDKSYEIVNGSFFQGSSNIFTAVGKQGLYLKSDDTAHTQVSLNTKAMVVSMDTLRGAETEVLKVWEGGVRVRGLLEVDDEMTTINTFAENLELFDKTITLAGAGMCNFTDGPNTNNKSGLKVGGLPLGKDPLVQADLDVYEKSFLFHCPSDTAMLNLNDPLKTKTSLQAFSAESYWELKGGDFRITQMKSATDMLTFAFRINAYEELELVKKYSVDGGLTYNTKVVSKFGRIVQC